MFIAEETQADGSMEKLEYKCDNHQFPSPKVIGESVAACCQCSSIGSQSIIVHTRTLTPYAHVIEHYGSLLGDVTVHSVLVAPFVYVCHNLSSKCLLDHQQLYSPEVGVKVVDGSVELLEPRLCVIQ